MTPLIDTRLVAGLSSPCCRTDLAQSDSGAECGACGTQYPMRSYGLDLVPPDLADRRPLYTAWTEVQAALTAWRARTWNRSDDAETRTRETKRMAGHFLDLTGVSGRVLDVGCGSGWIAELLGERGADYCGVDPMPATDSYPFPFARAVSDVLPFADARFDAVMFFSSLDYSLDVGATLAEAHRVLVPGGVLAIATPIHTTRQTSGERLHVHRFLAGDLEAAVGATFGTTVATHAWQGNYHFVWARR